MHAAILVIVVHALVSSPVALAIAPYSRDPAATSNSLWMLCIASAALSAVGFFATTTYLSKRIRTVTGLKVGLLCGLFCNAVITLVIARIDYSLVLYLALLAPTLLAVLLASLLERSKSGWQS
jgi:hypothetical protein